MSDHKEFCPEMGAGESIHKTVMELEQSKVVVCCQFGNCKDCFKKQAHK